MQTFIYIHGFNSDGDGWKAKALQRHFPDARVISPDFEADPLLVMEQLEAVFSQLKLATTCVLGTSLGGFYAYVCCAKYGVKTHLFNPSLAPFRTLDDRGIGQFYTWTKKRPYLFKKEYLPILVSLKEEADKLIDPSNCRFYLATDDTVLDHAPLSQLYPDIAIEWFDHAGHSFSKFEKVLVGLKSN